MKARTKKWHYCCWESFYLAFTVSAQSQKVSLDFKNERVGKSTGIY